MNRAKDVLSAASVAALITLAVSFYVPACKTTPDVLPDGTGKLVNCGIKTVIERAPDIYMTVSNIFTSDESYEDKRTKLLELAGKVGHETLVCTTRQYIADVEEDGRMGAKDPATAKGAEDARRYLEETKTSFDDPAPTPGAMKKPPSN